MSTAAVAIPQSKLELAEQFGDQLAYFPASFDEYWELLEKTDIRADYHNKHIIAMSYEPDYHSRLASRFYILLGTIFTLDQLDYIIFNSNRPIYTAECGSVFNPDGSVVLQPSIYFEYRPGMNVETTPFLIFEVLSPSTRNHDMATKLPCYKDIPTLKYIIYIELEKVKVSVHVREAENAWKETILSDKKQQIEIEGHYISLKDLYLGIPVNE